MYEEKLRNTISNISFSKIQKLRNIGHDNKKVNDYLFKMSQKIFIKFTNPYFRFEILSNCINDIIKNNKKFYPTMQTTKIKKISKKLKKICFYLNTALYEFYILVSDLEQL